MIKVLERKLKNEGLQANVLCADVQYLEFQEEFSNRLAGLSAFGAGFIISSANCRVAAGQAISKINMKYIFQTERLKLREFTLNDTQFIIKLLNSDGWLRFIGDESVRTDDQARSYLINGPLKSYRKNGFGLSLVEEKDDNSAIGMCGIIKRDNLVNPDIGFALLPEFIGKGYAFEIAKETLIYSKEKLKISKIYGITTEDNEKSIILLNKIGLNFIQKFNFPNDEEELLLYSS